MLVKVKVRLPGAYSDGDLWVQSEALPVGLPFEVHPPRRVKEDILGADDEGRLYRIIGTWNAGEPGILYADAAQHAATISKDEFGDRFWDEIDRALRR